VSYTYGVITEIRDVNGNLACALDIYQATDVPMQYERVNPLIALSLSTPVFQLGEILIFKDDGEREVVYPERKPGKWSVTLERFDTVEAAVARSQQVTTT
jgi:hypothetical protein